ncbi:LuxR C-terminal-related transcriptional regulator [Dasania marina]|uniref:LuxR C-terminal-related transcriptional regulator n=1 Tax=Dasania marina TaxID=471499 RepID=UPI0004B6E394|nr:LuxR C-terminal-related transcriptional regulator [Dasania marina]
MNKNNLSALIKTKLFAPVHHSGVVIRNKLLKKLAHAVHRKLTLITAPAGFGKTTLLGQWYESLQGSGNAVCWLSLDINDNDPRIFLRYVIAALQEIDTRIGADTLQYLENTPVLDISKPLGSLVNDLIQLDKETYLFLDDIHFIESEEIIDFLELLLNLSPANFHVVISGRSVPALPLANLRVRNDLMQIPAEKLRFDFDESEEFMLELRKLPLSKEQLLTLNEHCEGWAAGLQLASLSLREAENKDEVIHRFSGNIQDVADYLTAAVLNQQPQEVKDFLLSCSVFDRLNGDLCDYVLEQSGSQQIIQKLDADNLFIIPLDQDRNWYRFHHLFQEFLQAAARCAAIDCSQTLCRKACIWFKENGYLREAVDYALRAGDMSVAAELIEQRAIEEFMQGRMPRVTAWINKIPLEVRLKRPNLMLLHSTALYHMNQIDEAIVIRDQLEVIVATMAAEGELSKNSAVEFADEMAILNASISMSLDNVADVIRFSPEELHSHQDFMEGVINNVKGYSYFVLGEFEKAKQHISYARVAHQKINSYFGMMYSVCFLGLIEYTQGNVKRALGVLNEFQTDLLSRHEETVYITPALNVLRGAICYEMNQQEQAIQLLQPNLKLIEEVGHISLLQLGYTTLAKCFAAKEDYTTALKIMDHLADFLPLSKSNNYHRLFVSYHRIKLLLRAGKHFEALQAASLLEIPLDDPFIKADSQWDRAVFQQQFIQARLLLISGQWDALIAVSQGLYNIAYRLGLGHRAIESLLLLAQAQLKAGKQSQAVESMLLALSQAGANDLLRIFIDEGPGLSDVLALCCEADLTNNPMSRYMLEVLNQAIGLEASRLQSPLNQSAQMGLIEPLSQRELDVLKLIAEGKSNQLIADMLHISENTVKWHGKNIYGKLGVKNRTAAVITAQELKLISS